MIEIRALLLVAVSVAANSQPSTEASMATVPHSAKRSVALIASKPMAFLNAVTIRPTTITLERVFFRL